MGEKVEFLTPVGRLVAGDVFQARETDADGRPLTIKNGPNAGQPRVEYYFAIAIQKTDAGYNDLWSKIYHAGAASFPSLFANGAPCVPGDGNPHPPFSWKITDGDSQIPNTKGIKPCDREGWAGCWVLHMSSSYAPKCYTSGGAAVITDTNAIKRGYFIRVIGNAAGNDNTSNPGVYLNHGCVELVAYDDEINSGPDGSAFGAAPVAALPAGARATPPAASTVPAAAAPAPGVPAGAAPGSANNFPALHPAAAAPAPSAVQPARDFVANAGQPTAPAVAPAPAAAQPPAEKQYQDSAGNWFPESTLRGAGYTDEMLAALASK